MKDYYPSQFDEADFEMFCAMEQAVKFYPFDNCYIEGDTDWPPEDYLRHEQAMEEPEDPED